MTDTHVDNDHGPTVAPQADVDVIPIMARVRSYVEPKPGRSTSDVRNPVSPSPDRFVWVFTVTVQ